MKKKRFREPVTMMEGLWKEMLHPGSLTTLENFYESAVHHRWKIISQKFCAVKGCYGAICRAFVAISAFFCDYRALLMPDAFFLEIG